MFPKNYSLIFGIWLLSFSFFALLWVQPALADSPPALQTNGCGPKGWGWLVPDKMPISDCNFEEACRKHDLCWGKCLPGGLFAGLPMCNDPVSKKQRQKRCDEKLKRDIKVENGQRTICSVYASIYKLAVSAGGVFFDGREVEEFFRYLDKNPGKYDLESFRKKFYELADSNKKGYSFNFDVKNSKPDLLLSRGGRSENIQFEKIQKFKGNQFEKSPKTNYDRNHLNWGNTSPVYEWKEPSTILENKNLKPKLDMGGSILLEKGIYNLK